LTTEDDIFITCKSIKIQSKSMKIKSKVTIGEHFEGIQDPRIERTKLHNLMDIITITICAVICGSETWEDIEEYGKCKRKWLTVGA
jgi:DDE_Tnp_1-associated